MMWLRQGGREAGRGCGLEEGLVEGQGARGARAPLPFPMATKEKSHNDCCCDPGSCFVFCLLSCKVGLFPPLYRWGNLRLKVVYSLGHSRRAGFRVRIRTQEQLCDYIAWRLVWVGSGCGVQVWTWGRRCEAGGVSPVLGAGQGGSRLQAEAGAGACSDGCDPGQGLEESPRLQGEWEWVCATVFKNAQE